jgi:cell division GTPase FtsZ
MHILLLSAGGGGGNILRSVKAAFRRDLAVTQKSDPRYAERLRRAVTTRLLDTNEFALSDLPREERVLIGARTTGRLGARHDPTVAFEALNESRGDLEALFSRYSIIILIGTGGKGTGSGTMFPLAQIARQQRKLVIPIFVRPSFERHEVDKRHYDYAVHAIDQFDSAGIRLIEILNDRGYAEHDPQPQPVVWERMNLPIARGLRGLIYVLWDLSQVDPSDLSVLFAGHGRLRIGFAEIDPPDGGEPGDELVEQAARRCSENPYYAFRKPAGTSLICIQGDWSNLVDAKIKGRLAAAMGADAKSPYSPLYARAVGMPKPWGVTGLFAEYTGAHQPLDVDWSLERGVRTTVTTHRAVDEPFTVEDAPIAAAESPVAAEEHREEPQPTVVAAPPPPRAAAPPPPRPVAPSPPRAAAPSPPRTAAPSPPHAAAFATFWEFAVALNRSDPAAMALAGNGAAADIPIDGGELRKLLGLMWFRTMLARLSPQWRERILNVLVDTAAVPDHLLKLGRQPMHLHELTFEQAQEIAAKTLLPDWVLTDLDLVITVGRFWGADAMKRLRFVEAPQRYEPSMMETLLDRFRG